MPSLIDNLADAQYQPVKKRPWMDACEFHLGTVENLAAVIDACIASGRFSIDLETSGLDNRVMTYPSGLRRTVDTIAGVGLCPDGVRGYYFPLNHVAVDEMTGARTPRDCNIPISVWATAFLRLVAAVEAGQTVAVFHHIKFDAEFLQFNETGVPWGLWDMPKTVDDTMLGGYMRNTRARNRRLKDMSNSPPDAKDDHSTGGPGLGREMIELYELWGHDKEKPGYNYDFSVLDPTEEANRWYACGDVINTYGLWPILAPHLLNPATDGEHQRTVYLIEKLLTAAVRWMERNRIHINRAKVIELTALGQREWFDSIMAVYEEAERLLKRDVMPGMYHVLKTTFVPDDPNHLLPEQRDKAEATAVTQHPDPTGTVKGRAGKEWPAVYDVNSPQQLGVMFDEMGVPGLTRTEKSGQIKTSKAELERVIEEAGDQFPFMKKIRRFRETSKALSSYLYPMLLDSEPTDDTMRINFRQDGTDTGRFATPSRDSERGGGRRGFPQINLQSLPSTADPNRPECMSRIRECVSARPVPEGQPPKFFVAIDYAGVELRLVTNLSKESKWLNEFFRCSNCQRTFERGDGSVTPEPPPARCPNCGSDKIGDLHTLTALAIYGSDATGKSDWKALRGHAKATNFALCYGGGGNAVCRSTGVDKQEGWRIKNQFDKAYSGLKEWWVKQHRFATAHAFVRTAFGRRYPLPDIKSEDKGFQEKAKRNAVNGPIQGTSADITKIAMALIYKECKKRGWLDKCMMVLTMHDELGFEIDADIIEEAIPVLVTLMVRNEFVLSKRWPVPLTTDVEIGTDWTVPWDLNGMTFGEVRFKGNKKIKDKKKAIEMGLDWDALPKWPDALAPWFKAAGRDPTPQTGGSGPGTPPDATEPPPEAPIDVTVSNEPPADPRAVGAYTKMPSSEITSMIDPISGEFTFTLGVPLTHAVIGRLAGVIHKCASTGMNALRLRSRAGESLDGWLKVAGFPAFHVAPESFYAEAQREGLVG